jgi:hypothetical protein
MARRERSGGRMGVLRTLNLLAFLPLAPRVPTYSKLLISLARDERVPASRKALLAAAGAYVSARSTSCRIGCRWWEGSMTLSSSCWRRSFPVRVAAYTSSTRSSTSWAFRGSELEEDMRRVRRMVPSSVRAIAAAQSPMPSTAWPKFCRQEWNHGRVRRLTQMEGEPLGEGHF